MKKRDYGCFRCEQQEIAPIIGGSNVRMCMSCFDEMRTVWQGRLFDESSGVRLKLVKTYHQKIRFGGASLRCNMCGGDRRPKLSREAGFNDAYGFSVRFSGGYFSEELQDWTQYSFSLCESCIAKMMKKFAIPAIAVEKINYCSIFSL